MNAKTPLIWRILTITAIFLSVFTLYSQGASRIKEIRANRFVLEDISGQEVAVLEAYEDFSSFRIGDVSGENFVSIHSSSRCASIILKHASSPSLVMRSDETGTTLEMFSQVGNVSFGVKDWKKSFEDSIQRTPPNGLLDILDQGACIKVENSSGTVRIGSGPRIRIEDSKGFISHYGIGEAIYSNGTIANYPASSIRFFGPSGQMLWEAK